MDCPWNSLSRYMFCMIHIATNIFCVVQILHLGAFKQPRLIVSGRFALSGSGFAQIFGQIVSTSVKKRNNTNLVALTL